MTETDVSFVEKETRYINKMVILSKKIVLKLNFGKQYEPFYWFRASVETADGKTITNKICDMQFYVYGWYVQFLVGTIKGDR